jgi:hypothetical protein
MGYIVKEEPDSNGGKCKASLLIVVGCRRLRAI